MRFATTCFLMAALLGAAACNTRKPTPAPPPSVMDLGGMPAIGGPGENGSPIRDTMVLLAKGPKSLISSIGSELQAETPEWEAIQTKSKEAAAHAAELDKYEPRRGSKESWGKQTASFTDLLTALDKAVQDKDKKAAQAAHQTVSGSCKSCHDEHRAEPGGKGGKGGKGGFGGKKGGPATP